MMHRWIRHALYAVVLGVFFELTWSLGEIHAARHYAGDSRATQLGIKWASYRGRRTAGRSVQSIPAGIPKLSEQEYEGIRDQSPVVSALDSIKDDDISQELILPPELAPADSDKTFASMVVTTVVGEKVALPCSVEPAERAGDDAAVLVLWYKDEIPQPVFTVDARASGGASGTQHHHTNQIGVLLGLRSAPQTSSLDQLNGRATFEIDHKPAFLQFQPVAESDAGEYRCRVDFKRARSMNTVINLRVIVPPGQPIVSTEEDAEPVLSDGLAGPFNEGEPLTLFCTAKMGKPRASLLWLHNGRVIDESFSYDLINNVVRNTLEIPVLSRDHLLVTYICQSTNNNITRPSQTTITIDVNVRPLDVKIESSTRALSAGSPAKFICSSSGSRPPAHLSWWKGNQELLAQSNEDFIANDDGGMLGASSTVSVLMFTPKAEDHGASLVCRAKNTNLPDKAIQHTQTLDVHYAPQVTLTLGANLRPDEIFENRDVYLDCDINANPLTSEVVWHFEGRELQTDKYNGIIVSSSSLVLQKVSKSQRGWYTCSTSNRMGSVVSNRLFLRVKYAPRCQPGQRHIFGVDIFESAQITCNLDADPSEEIDFTWSFNNSGYLDNNDSYSHNRHHPQPRRYNSNYNPNSLNLRRSSSDIINYQPLTEQDYGELLCFGRNEVGVQKVPCVYYITPAMPPQAPENCTQVNATDNGFTVECFEGLDGAWNGGHIPQYLSYVAELYDSDHAVNMSLGVASVSAATLMKSPAAPMCLANVSVAGTPGNAPLLFVFADVPRAENNEAGYRVYIYAVNRKGRSTVTRVVAHVLNASKYTQTSGGAVRLAVLRPVLGLLLGLLVTSTLIGIFAFTVATCHKRCQDAQQNGCVSQKDINKWGMTLLKSESTGHPGPDADSLECDCNSPICHSLPPLPLDTDGRSPSLLDLNQQQNSDAESRCHRRRRHHYGHQQLHLQKDHAIHPDIIQQQQSPREFTKLASYTGGRYIDHRPDPDLSHSHEYRDISLIHASVVPDCIEITHNQSYESGHTADRSDEINVGGAILTYADSPTHLLNQAQCTPPNPRLKCNTPCDNGKTRSVSIKTDGSPSNADSCSRFSAVVHQKIPQTVDDLLINDSSSAFYGRPRHSQPSSKATTNKNSAVLATQRSNSGETLSFTGTGANLSSKTDNDLTSFISRDDSKSNSRESCV